MRKIVGTIRDKPPNPKTKFVPNLSNPIEVTIAVIVKVGIAHKRKLCSFRTNGKTKRNSPIGIIKNWIPPHAEKANMMKSPAPTNFKKEILLFFALIPLKNKYNPIIPKNNPRGSDLNHPNCPRIIIGKETEKNNAENNPAVVPPITLTKANTTTQDNEPIIAGNKIVKS